MGLAPSIPPPSRSSRGPSPVEKCKPLYCPLPGVDQNACDQDQRDGAVRTRVCAICLRFGRLRVFLFLKGLGYDPVHLRANFFGCRQRYCGPLPRNFEAGLVEHLVGKSLAPGVAAGAAGLVHVPQPFWRGLGADPAQEFLGFLLRQQVIVCEFCHDILQQGQHLHGVVLHQAVHGHLGNLAARISAQKRTDEASDHRTGRRANNRNDASDGGAGRAARHPPAASAGDAGRMHDQVFRELRPRNAV